MEYSNANFLFVLFSMLCLGFLVCSNADDTLQTYLVQLHPDAASHLRYGSRLQWHLSLITEFAEEECDASSRLLYSYTSVMDGFAAQLSWSEVELLRKSEQVVAVRPDRKLELHTTYSYKFLGLSPTSLNGAWAQSRFGRGSIIGVLDTGVWPESPSFNDHGFPPVPKKWKGICQQGQHFNASTCNRKLIGARFFSKGHNVGSLGATSSKPLAEYVSPRDSRGHGTHTASTAGGSQVRAASVLGFGEGDARGMAPGAHIAVYKVCWFSGCYSSDILAAMDAAIVDGVDVLSLSLGGFPVPLYEDTIAIASFRATEHGISVICSAGNNGPSQGSVTNEAPWVATIGASTLDRRFGAAVRLRNGKLLYGESMYPGKGLKSAERELDLVYLSGGNQGSELCLRGYLPRAQVQGKMVVCDRGVNGRAEKGQAVKESGGAAMILANTDINLEEDSVDAHVLPATIIGFDEAVQLKSYINSTEKPRAKIIFGGNSTRKARAPAVALFSSRGPSYTDPSVLKPDMIAPGVNIIAAWPQNLGPTGLSEDFRRVNFTVMSGTSMSCPHVSGLAALIRSAHPHWSPAAIKSALMTTADILDHRGKSIMDGDKPADIFAMGTGHVNPERAMNPGLIYDIKPEEYVTHLCSLGYSKLELLSITQRNLSCHEILQKNRGFSLNYPSFSIIFSKGETWKMIQRRVTNVGTPDSVYTVQIIAPKGVSIRIRPTRLKFDSTNQTLTYRVWFILKNIDMQEDSGMYSQGYLAWVNKGNHYRVRSPISVQWSSKK